VLASHDGYVKAFGPRHSRRLHVSRDGVRIEGEDRLGGIGSRLRLAGDLPFAIHFHLHPETGVGGPIVGTDAANKNYVDSEISKLDDELSAGIAIATALENPDLTGSETFGVMVNYGNYQGSSAVAISMAGVLGTNVFGAGDRVSIAGGVGVSTDGGDVAGRVGIQWTQ
jgi:hypothetical protein